MRRVSERAPLGQARPGDGGALGPHPRRAGPRPAAFEQYTPACTLLLLLLLLLFVLVLLLLLLLLLLLVLLVLLLLLLLLLLCPHPGTPNQHASSCKTLRLHEVDLGSRGFAGLYDVKDAKQEKGVQVKTLPFRCSSAVPPLPGFL